MRRENLQRSREKRELSKRRGEKEAQNEGAIQTTTVSRILGRIRGDWGARQDATPWSVQQSYRAIFSSHSSCQEAQTSNLTHGSGPTEKTQKLDWAKKRSLRGGAVSLETSNVGRRAWGHDANTRKLPVLGQNETTGQASGCWHMMAPRRAQGEHDEESFVSFILFLMFWILPSDVSINAVDAEAPR
ncbi:hypothetical protein GGI35DRAFT_442445 [Trichoderma velutinum]